MAKAIKKQALGRGLSALLQDPKKETQTAESTSSSHQVRNYYRIRISSNRSQSVPARTQFKEEAIRELAASIQELGVIQPITVRKTKQYISIGFW